MTFRARFAIPLAASILASGAARADEGMWTFDAFPAARMKADYGWAPDQAWLDKVRASAVRLTGGCSASFVSPQGLILTNHHCVISCLSNLSKAGDDLVANGFNPAERSRERQCPGQQAEVVTSIKDVTADVKAAIGNATGEALVRARDGRIAALEKAGCTDTAKTRCQVVTLFGGGQYKLYTYRKYSDVRIAWAPEFAAAFFGGDPDNFNFPRYALDAAFLRAYENGKPAATPAHLQWSPRAPVEGEATFVVGNPGSTRRLLTLDQVALQRDVALPLRLLLLSEYRGRMISAMGTNPDRLREGGDTLFGIENSFKARYGQHQALLDRDFAARLAAAERDLKSKTADQAAWGTAQRAAIAYRDFYHAHYFLEAGPGYGSTLYNYAHEIVRLATERAKPDSERLAGYSDSRLPLLEKEILDPVPSYPWLEELTLAFWLSKTREYLTVDNPMVKRLLGKESPEALAKRLVAGTRLADPAYRKQLVDGGLAAVQASDDPLIRFALANEADGRALLARYEAEVDAPTTAAQSQLAAARFAAYGDANYPDATFTLRISYGKVAGWTYRGTTVPFATRLGGTFERATGSDPFNVARGFAAAEARLDKNTVYNFVTTNDIIGGNSGSPVIDRQGRVIGAAFDGNIHSLGGDYGYDGSVNRTVVVSAAAVDEALRKVWPAPALVAELGGGKR
jgi:hypothetical protein